MKRKKNQILVLWNEKSAHRTNARVHARPTEQTIKTEHFIKQKQPLSIVEIKRAR